MYQGKNVSRREMLALLGAAGATMLASSSFAQASRNGTLLPCVATPEQTEGPYFVDEGLRRTDIRVDPSDGSVKEGVPLVLHLFVSTIDSSGCKPLAGAIVDIWHCDALGIYSDIQDRRSSTIGKKFLRGFQVTGPDGQVRFTTVYPGWYQGRTVHIHFKARTNSGGARTHELTSQLYFDEAATARVAAQQPYAGRRQRRIRNEEDSLFRNGGDRLVLPLVENAQEQGYSARFDIGLQMA